MSSNGCGQENMFTSPVINHLIDADHQKIILTNDVRLGKTSLECERCGTNNPLVLGFTSIEPNSVTVVLSRQTYNEECNTMWKELNDDRYFLSFTVKIPKISSKQVRHDNLGNCFGQIIEANTNSHTENEGNRDSGVDPKPVLLRYDSGREYKNIFGPLIKLESDFQRNLAESIRKQVNITVRWDDLSSKKVKAYFILSYDDAVWKLMHGDKLRLKYRREGANWTGVGRVIKLPENFSEEVGLEIETNSEIPLDCRTGFTVTQVWNSISCDRMRLAIEKFAEESLSQSNILHDQILGHNLNNLLIDLNNFKLQSIPNLPALNHSQTLAAKKAVQRSLTLIEGPPGTGKTITLLTILYNLVKQNEGPILVCAPSNVAVDQLAQRINRIKLSVIRLYPESRAFVNSPASFLSLESKVRNLPGNTEFKKLLKLREEGHDFLPKDEKRYRDLKKMAERKVLDDTEVVCCTCIAAGDPRLAAMTFRVVLIDESIQATEPECLIPITLGCEQLILVGDILQLTPVIKCKEALKAGLKQSLFQRLAKIGIRSIQLTSQYRMHPALSRFPSNYFYEGNLQNGVVADERKLSEKIFPWPVSDFPMLFWVVRSCEERTWPVLSYLNRAEASVVEIITTHLLKQGITPDRIGIVTQYEGQRKYIPLCLELQGPLNAKRYKQVEVSKVDAFQGREKDIIILSCVRSQGTTGIGSLNYIRHMNLILTRAKYGLFIVGNPIALSKQQMWKDFLHFCRKEKILVEGELNSLKESNVQF